MIKKIYLTYLIGLHLKSSTESNLIEWDKNFQKLWFCRFYLSTYPYPLTTATYYKSSTTQHNASAYHSTFPTVGSISLIRLRFLFEITVSFKVASCIESFTKRTESAYTTESSPVQYILLKLDTTYLRRHNPDRTFCLHINSLHEMYPPLFHRLVNKKPMLCLF